MEKIPKYLNSPETEIFHKHLVLFAFNVASNNVSNNNPFIITEGYMDVLSMHQFGFNTTIGTMGTALSEDHLCNIWKYCDEPIICMDGDKAGYNSMVKIANMALSKLIPGKSMKFVIIPNNDDPDSYIKSYGKEAMENLLKNNLNLIDFLWAYFFEKFSNNNKTPEKIALWEQEIYNTIEKISNDRIRTFYKSEIKNRIYHLTKQLFYRKSSNKINNNLTINEYSNQNLNEKLLLYILIMRPCIIQFVIEDLFRIPFSNASLSNIRNRIAEIENQVIIKNNNMENNINVIKNDMKVNHDELIELIDDLKNNSIVENITNQCSKICKIDKLNNDELVKHWYYLLDRVVFASQNSNEIDNLSNECKNEINNNNWQRLKSLKMYLLSKRKK